MPKICKKKGQLLMFLGGKIGGTVPKKGEHSVLFLVRMQCNAMQYNTLQYNAMQCNAMAQPNARKNAMSCSIPCIRCPRALAMPSSYRALTQAQCFHLLSILFVFFFSVLIIKRRQSPILRKNAMSYTHPCTVSFKAGNAIQPRRKERSSAECAAATLCLPLTACQIEYNVVPTSCLRSAREKK